jgi:ABC-type transport system substrate-binding protein
MRINKLGMFIVLGILALFIVGCSKSSPTDKCEESGTSTGEKTVETNFTGGDLRIALNTQPPTLDVHMGTTTATRDATRPIFETLVTLNSNYEVKPLLAERFEDYKSPEGISDGLAGKREALVDNLYFDIIIDGSTRVAGITTGQYDIGISMPTDNFAQLEAAKNVENEVALSAGLSFIFNEKEGILKDAAMRLALNTALDYEGILLAAFSSPDFYRLSPGIMFPEQADWHTDAG